MQVLGGAIPVKKSAGASVSISTHLLSSGLPGGGDANPIRQEIEIILHPKRGIHNFIACKTVA